MSQQQELQDRQSKEPQQDSAWPRLLSFKEAVTAIAIEKLAESRPLRYKLNNYAISAWQRYLDLLSQYPVVTAFISCLILFSAVPILIFACVLGVSFGFLVGTAVVVVIIIQSIIASIAVTHRLTAHLLSRIRPSTTTPGGPQQLGYDDNSSTVQHSPSTNSSRGSFEGCDGQSDFSDKSQDKKDESNTKTRLDAAGDADWASFATRIKRAIKSGHIHTHEVSNGFECTVTIDNELTSTSRGGNISTSKPGATRQPVELHVEMTRVATDTKNQKVNELLFDLMGFAQKHGCSFQSDAEFSNFAGDNISSRAEATGDRDFESLKMERDNYKNEAAQLKQQLERLQASVSSMPGGSQLVMSSASKPRSKAGKNAMLNAHLANKKRKGQSLVNPRVRAVPKAKGTEFDDDDDDDEDDE
ncbi:hypothetical protein BGW41_001701 [Actinomortierella wolfii]|nr:hypothetical protein BGW41_001701 [Actinomortierella wolfii]